MYTKELQQVLSDEGDYSVWMILDPEGDGICAVDEGVVDILLFHLNRGQ